VTGKSGDWVAITDERDRDGWVDASLLENVELERLPVIEDAPAAEPEKPASLRKVAGSGVTVRSGPGKSNKALFNLSGGAQVSVLDESKGWLKIKDAEGRTGWAYKTYVRG
jgi:SH3-like domain-containing protein